MTDLAALRMVLNVIEHKEGPPLVGLPMAPKQKPLVFKRELVQAAAAGLPVEAVTVELIGVAVGERVALRVSGRGTTASGGRLERRTTVLPMHVPYWWDVRNRQAAWAESQRTKVVKVRPANKFEGKALACEAEIERLQKQLTTERPWSKCLKYRLSAPPAVWQGHREEREASDWERERELKWRAEKALRRKVAKVVAPWLAWYEGVSRQVLDKWGEPPRHKWQELWRRLEAVGVHVEERQRWQRIGHLTNAPTEKQYLCELWKYVRECGCMGRPRQWRDRDSEGAEAVKQRAKDHRNELVEVANAMRERDAILNQIETLKQLVVSYREQAAQIVVVEVQQ